MVDDGFVWLAEPVVYDGAGLALNDADAGRFLAVLWQRLRSVEYDLAHHLAVDGIYPRVLSLVWESEVDSETG